MEKNFKTLSEIVDLAISLYELDDTKKNKYNIKTKFKRVLIEDGRWSHAKLVPKKKNQTKCFSRDDVEFVLEKSEDYLTKLAGMSIQEIKNRKEENEKIALDFFNFHHSNIEYEDLTYSDPEKYEEQRIEKEMHNVMLQALFEKFFTPIDKDLWLEDELIVRGAGYIMSNPNDEVARRQSPDYIRREKRLESHNKSAYYEERK